MDRLLLWDIDGTLITGGGVSGAALRAAMTRFFGPISGLPISYAGKTDQQILLETYPDRAPTDILGALADFTPIYLEELTQRQAALRSHGRVLPGAAQALARLHRQRGVLQTLLTGNIQAAAQIKLATFGLAGFVDFACGAYGSDHHERSRLVPIAVERAAARFGQRFVGSAIVVVGDTPNDIACGKAAHARTVGVASGTYHADALHAAGADCVLADLTDTEAVVQAISGEAAGPREALHFPTDQAS